MDSLNSGGYFFVPSVEASPQPTVTPQWNWTKDQASSPFHGGFLQAPQTIGQNFPLQPLKSFHMQPLQPIYNAKGQEVGTMGHYCFQPQPQLETEFDRQPIVFQNDLRPVDQLPYHFQEFSTLPVALPQLQQQQEYPMGVTMVLASPAEQIQFPQDFNLNFYGDPYTSINAPVACPTAGLPHFLPPIDFALLHHHVKEFHITQQHHQNLVRKKTASSNIVRKNLGPTDHLIGYCRLCENNGKATAFVNSHVLRDIDGIVRCPVLREHVCRICHATGDNAHTLRYCPVLTEWMLQEEIRRQSRH